MELWQMSASDASRRMAAGELSSEAYTRALLARIAEREPPVHAWANMRWLQLVQRRYEDARLLQGAAAVAGVLDHHQD